MLGDILDVVGKQLNAFLSTKIPHAEEKTFVLLSSPVTNSDSFFPHGDGLYCSLLNIEEELILREGSVSRRVIGDGTLTRQPPVNINLQMIFIANYSSDYKMELNLIYWVMAFFQAKPLFNLKNTPELADCGFTGDDKLLFELNTLPLRELHYIWGNLGMKQTPSVTYQIKMLTIQDRGVVSEGGVVNSIELVNKG